jgi:hypothetical protein
MLDGQSHFLELGPDGAIEDDDLALADAFLQIVELAHVFPPRAEPTNVGSSDSHADNNASPGPARDRKGGPSTRQDAASLMPRAAK